MGATQRESRALCQRKEKDELLLVFLISLAERSVMDSDKGITVNKRKSLNWTVMIFGVYGHIQTTLRFDRKKLSLYKSQGLTKIKIANTLVKILI